MKTVVVAEHGGPESLTLVERPEPQPGPGEVRVRVRVAGVNYADVMSRTGAYPTAPALPFTPGTEIVGVLDALGDGVDGLLGGRVAAMLPDLGGYQEAVVVSAAQAVPLPDDLPDDEAAALLVQGLTAAGLVDAAGGPSRLRDTTVLVTAAVGGVGTLLVQLLVEAGAQVIAAVGGESKARLAKELGAQVTARYDKNDWVAATREQLEGAGPSGVAVVLDSVGGDVYRAALGLLDPGGTAVVYGAASGELVGAPPEITGMLIGQNQAVRGFSLPPRIAADPTWLPNMLGSLMSQVRDGSLVVHVHPPFALEDAAAAHAAIEERRTTGKVVLTVGATSGGVA
ncbi:MAG: quinone oxidoreductase family protein [Angustibacter sp.]